MHSREVPLSALDGMNSLSSSQKRGNAQFGFVLIVIDTCAGPFQEITRAVAGFRRDLNENYFSRVVWLDKPDVNSKNFDEDKLPAFDFVICKSFHGSRLYQTIRLLPEFGGVVPRKGDIPNTIKETGEIEATTVSAKPLMGKKILVADDNPMGRKIATSVASQLGAVTFSCENGEAAWKLVCKSLNDKTIFYYILMDCEMPVMGGAEATARIKEAEEGCGVRTPIIALTARTWGEEVERMVQAGVVGCISKPLNKDDFLAAIWKL